MAVRLIKCEEQNDVLFKKIVVDDYSSSTAIIVPDTHNAIIIKDGIALTRYLVVNIISLIKNIPSLLKK